MSGILPAEPPDPESLARVRALSERTLSAEEFEAYVNAPMSEEELQEIWEAIDWFMKRYPTPAERFAATRRAYATWSRSAPR